MTQFRVITDAPGQMCNRFWSYLDSVGWAIANNRHVYILYWDKSIKDYDVLRAGRYTSFPLYSNKGISKMGYEKYNYYSHRLFPNNKIASYFCYKTRFASSRGFIQGWDTRSATQFIPQYKQQIIRLFMPNAPIKEGVEHLINRYRSRGFFIIGVHIRKGDYAEFLNGKYNFDISQYKQWMSQLVHLYDDRKVCFYVSTNEKYEKETLDAFTVIQPTMQNAAYDLYALSLCDRIIGPISTFSRWASFVGDVPLCFLRRRMTLLDDRMFSPIKDYYHFANGKEIVSVKGLEDRHKRFIKSWSLKGGCKVANTPQ